MRYEAVLYDMDGTVLNTLTDLASAVNYTLRSFGQPEVSRQKVRASLGSGAALLLRRCLPEEVSQERLEEILRVYKPYYAANCNIKTQPYDGIVSLMERLKERGIKQAIVSNKPDGAVKELAGVFFPGLIEEAVGESETVKRKPDPAAVLAAAKLLGAVPEKCVYIGDSEEDVLTAKNAGMDGISVTWGFRDEAQLINAGARQLAHSVEELEKILLGENKQRMVFPSVFLQRFTFDLCPAAGIFRRSGGELADDNGAVRNFRTRDRVLLHTLYFSAQHGDAALGLLNFHL